LGAEPFKLLLLVRLDQLAGLRGQGEHWLFPGILVCLAPTFLLLGVQAPFPAAGLNFGGVQPSGSSTTVNLSVASQLSGSFSDAGTTFPCIFQVFL
jgi:hypothetical protein